MRANSNNETDMSSSHLTLSNKTDNPSDLRIDKVRCRQIGTEVRQRRDSQVDRCYTFLSFQCGTAATEKAVQMQTRRYSYTQNKKEKWSKYLSGSMKQSSIERARKSQSASAVMERKISRAAETRHGGQNKPSTAKKIKYSTYFFVDLE